LVDLHVVFQRDAAFVEEDLLQELIDFFLVLLSLSKGHSSKLVAALGTNTFARSGRAGVIVKLLFILERDIRKQDADVLLCHEAIVVEVEPER
jgi:hypothetical protein